MRYFDANRRELFHGVPFELDGFAFPGNFLALSTPEEIAARGITVEPDPEPAPPPPPTVTDYGHAIQSHIDGTAQARGYDNGVALVSYLSSTNPSWAAEAATFNTWRDAVWAYAYGELAKVQGGQRAQPTIAEFVAELPQVVWP